MTTLDTLSKHQLWRLYKRLYKRLERDLDGGGMFGMDAATLNILYPQTLAVMMNIKKRFDAMEPINERERDLVIS